MSQGASHIDGMNLVELLSSNQIRVFVMTANGAPPGAIARELKLSVKTVSTHLRRIHDKTGLGSMAQIAIYAFRKGWVSWPLKMYETEACRHFRLTQTARLTQGGETRAES